MGDVGEPRTTAERLEDRLVIWADARDRRNPSGHGKTGTQLLRDAAAELVVVRERAEQAEKAVSRYVKQNAEFETRFRAAEERAERLERAKETLLRWCDEDGGSVKGYMTHADIRAVLAEQEKEHG